MEGCFGCSPWNNLKIRSGASVRSAIFLMIITSKYPSETDARGQHQQILQHFLSLQLKRA